MRVTWFKPTEEGAVQCPQCDKRSTAIRAHGEHLGRFIVEDDQLVAVKDYWNEWRCPDGHEWDNRPNWVAA